MHIELYSHHKLVHSETIPSEKGAIRPAVIIWGNRVFLHSYSVHQNGVKTQRYKEASAYALGTGLPA